VSASGTSTIKMKLFFPHLLPQHWDLLATISVETLGLNEHFFG